MTNEMEPESDETLPRSSSSFPETSTSSSRSRDFGSGLASAIFLAGAGIEPGNSGDELTSTTSESMGHLEGIRTLVMIAMDQSK